MWPHCFANNSCKVEWLSSLKGAEPGWKDHLWKPSDVHGLPAEAQIAWDEAAQCVG